MSDTTTTMTPTEADQKEAAVLAKHGKRLATLFSDSKSTFDRAKLIHTMVEAGATHRGIALDLSLRAAREAFPSATDERIIAVSTSAKNAGGTKVANGTISSLYGAWMFTVEAGVPQDVEHVKRAFTVVSTAKTAEGKAKLVEELKDLDYDSTKAILWDEGTQRILDNARNGRKPIEARPNDGTSTDESGAETVNFLANEDVPLPVEVALGLLERIGRTEWTDEEQAAILDALEAAQARVIHGEPVNA